MNRTLPLRLLPRLLCLLMAAALTGCAATGTASGGGAGAGPSTSTKGRAAPAAPAKVRDRWRPGVPELGAQVLWYAYPRETDAQVRTEALRVVDYIVSKDMNSISVSFPFGTSSITADSVQAISVTPSVRHLAVLLDTAAEAGLRITLRPLLDEKTLVAENPLAWRGSLAPNDPAAWFSSYESFLKPYLALAADHHVRTFVIGAEFTSLEEDPHWQDVVSSARRVFRGEIGYDANWDDYASRHIPVPVSSLGVDAYPPLPQLGDSAPVSAIVAGWQQWLDRKSGGELPRVLFSEVGAPAEDGAYQHPGLWNGTGTLNQAVQKNWFTAACEVARQRDMAGLYWWNIDFHADPATADPKTEPHSSFLGRTAESAITSCFQAWYSAAAAPGKQ